MNLDAPRPLAAPFRSGPGRVLTGDRRLSGVDPRPAGARPDRLPEHASPRTTTPRRTTMTAEKSTTPHRGGPPPGAVCLSPRALTPIARFTPPPVGKQ